MLVKESIYTYIVEHLETGKGVDASEIAEVFSIQRNMASHYLNRLADEGKLIKTNTRPVHFLIPKEGQVPNRADLVFSDFIGSNGSAAQEIERCKAAVTYPGNGLPLIIRGNSGVGKSFLASLIHRYAEALGIINKNSPFIVLNCADYANNTELLSSILFGYVKGAFTGANEDRTGLLDEADNGYLFLDEIHNLSAENQEKLFLFIDSQKFRRLGDSKHWQTARVRLIFATTEDIQSRLLSTFRRRIPLEIRLPDFSERSLGERFQIVSYFLRQEAKILNRKLKIDINLLKELLENKEDGNIGAVKNQIKVICASAYNRQKTPVLYLSRTAPSESSPYYEIQAKEGLEDDLAHLFARLPYKELKGNSIASLKEAIEHFMKQVQDEILFSYYSEEYFWDCEQVRCFETHASQVIQQTLLGCGMKSGALDTRNLILFLLCLLAHKEPTALSLQISRREQKQYFKHIQLAEKILLALKLPAGYPPASFIYLTAAFLYQTLPIQIRIPAIILMHGESSASSIARLANSIVGSYIYEAFDMPMDVGTGELIQQVNSCIEDLDTRQGLAVLVDMGSLEQMYDQIKVNVEGDLVVINNVSTAVAIDIASKISNGAGILAITELDYEYFQVKRQFYKGISRKPNIVVSCISGEGIAGQIRDILSSYIDGELVDVVTMNYSELNARLAENDRQIFKNTLAVLTTNSISSNLVPIISIEDIVEGNTALKTLEPIICPESILSLGNDIIKMFTLKGAASRLNFLNPEKIIDQVDQVISRYEQTMGLHFPNFLRVNMFLHISIMIERIMVRESRLEDRFWKDLEKKPEVQTFIQLSKEIFTPVMNRYKLEIPNQEYILIWQMIQSGITRPDHLKPDGEDE